MFENWIWPSTSFRVTLGGISHGMTSTLGVPPMTSIRLPYIKQYADRHGKVRRYLRRRGFPASPLPGQPGMPEFMQAYQAALGGPPAQRQGRDPAGSIGALVTAYYRSVEFANLASSSQSTYRTILAPIVAEHGGRSVAGLDRPKVASILRDIAERRGRGVANLTRSVLSLLMKFAIGEGATAGNPVLTVKRYKGGTHHAWTDVQLEQYERRWPIGTRERLAYELLLLSVQRGCDVVGIKRNEIVNGEIIFKQRKTGAELTIPVHPTLMRAIKAWAKGITIFGDKHGRKVKRAALAQCVKRAAEQAGLPPQCKPHGLRKAAMRRLAESGASAKELQSVSGHKSLAMVELYTAAADQKKLARSAIAKLKEEG